MILYYDTHRNLRDHGGFIIAYMPAKLVCGFSGSHPGDSAESTSGKGHCTNLPLSSDDMAALVSLQHSCVAVLKSVFTTASFGRFRLAPNGSLIEEISPTYSIVV